MENTMDKIEFYARLGFNALNASKHLWDEGVSTHIERALPRQGMYHPVFDCGSIKTGLSTIGTGHIPQNQFQERGLTEDHYMAPQTCGKFILDTPEYLEDFEKFFEFFNFCRRTIIVTKKQNEELKQLTKKENVLTKDRYHHLGYKLYDSEGLLPEGNQVLDVPHDYTIWEEKFIKNSFRPFVVKSPKASSLVGFL